LRSPLSTVPAGIIVPAFPQRSPPRHLIAAACGGLRSAPDCRTRRALLHLSYSCAPPVLTTVLVSHDPWQPCADQECCCASLWHLAASCLLFVDRQLQLAHELAHPGERPHRSRCESRGCAPARASSIPAPTDACSCRHPTTVLSGGPKSAKIHVSSETIWGIPVDISKKGGSICPRIK
jgi:hypothetical protein